jgi:histidinol-phosphate aminotransferase
MEASWSGTDLLANRRGFDANGVIRLNSNENPYGPPADAVDAIMQAFGEANRYPAASDQALRAAIARRHGVKEENILIGAGSGETLRLATEFYTSPTRHLVSAAPTFENPTTNATRLQRTIKAPRVDSQLRLDLDAMLAAAPGAGLVFLCNPNNPTGTVYSLGDVLEFIKGINRRAPQAAILVDEAYYEYVDHPGYGTAIPTALQNPSVIVSRTFSKVFGLAGMRVGYAIGHADTIRKLEPWRLANGVSQLASAAAIACCELPEHVTRQQQLNRDARDFTLKQLKATGHTVFPSHTNFVLVDVKRDAKALQKTLLERGVAIGRPFPPLDTHARISIGTMDEMKKALPVIVEALKG